MRNHFALLRRDPTLRMICLCTLSFGAFVASVGAYQSLVAVEVLGMSEAAYAAVLFAALLVTVAVSIGIGILTDQRPSRRRMALIAASAIVLGGLIVSLGQSIPAFVVAHVFLMPLSGTLFGQMIAVARLVTAPLAWRDREGVMALVRAMFAIPWLVVTPFWGRLADAGVSLLAIYPGLVLFGLATLALVWRRWPEDAAAPWTEVKSGLGFRASLREMMRPGVFLRVQLAGVLQVGGMMSGILVGLCFAEAGRGTSEVAGFFALFVGIEAAATMAVGWFLTFGSRLQVISCGVILYALYLCLLPVLAPTPWVWALAVPAGIGGGMIYALVISYLADLMGARAGAGASLLALSRIGTDSTASAALWLGTALSGLGLVAWIAAAATLAALGAIHLLDRRRLVQA